MANPIAALPRVALEWLQRSHKRSRKLNQSI